MKATSRGLSGGKHNQVIIVSNTRNRSRVCLFLTTEDEQLFILKAIMVNYAMSGSYHCYFFLMQ